jgi:hypothetical protein
MNVSAFKGAVPASAFAGLNPQQESLSDGIGSGYAVVGYKGKVWTLRHRGEKYTFVRADDGSPSAFLDVIILRSVPYKSKSYYPSFTDGSSDRPICAALDGITPDADVQQKQASACAICPRNEWKTNPDGHKGRECTDYKRLAVLILPSLTARLLGAPLMEPAFLRVPAGSLNDLGIFGDSMSAQGFHYSSYVTRIGFDPAAPHPKMSFKAIQALTDKEGPVVLPMREDPMALRITGESEISRAARVHPLAAPVQAVAAQPIATASVSPAKPVAAAPVARSEEPVDMGFSGTTIDVVANKPAPVTAAVKDPEADTFVDTGFGVTNVVRMAPPKNTDEDTGAIGEADADLDARIAAKLAGLMPK